MNFSTVIISVTSQRVVGFCACDVQICNGCLKEQCICVKFCYSHGTITLEMHVMKPGFTVMTHITNSSPVSGQSPSSSHPKIVKQVRLNIMSNAAKNTQNFGGNRTG